MSEEIGEIVGILAKNGIAEFEHEEKGKKLKIKCRTTIQPSKKSLPKKEPNKEIEKEPAKEQEQQEIQLYTLKSLQVGYFHILKKTGEKAKETTEQIQEQVESLEEPFVKIGDKVNLENILGTVESMRLQNEIKLTDYKDFPGNYGIIEKILGEEGAPVDYGRPLFQIRPVKEGE